MQISHVTPAEFEIHLIQRIFTFSFFELSGRNLYWATPPHQPCSTSDAGSKWSQVQTALVSNLCACRCGKESQEWRCYSEFKTRLQELSFHPENENETGRWNPSQQTTADSSFQPETRSLRRFCTFPASALQPSNQRRENCNDITVSTEMLNSSQSAQLPNTKQWLQLKAQA